MSTAPGEAQPGGNPTDILGSYKASGYAVVPGVFDDTVVRRMGAFWDEVSARRRSEGRNPLSTLVMPHRAFPEVAAIVRHPPLVAYVETLLEGDIDLIESQMMYGRPGTQGYSPHQDSFYTQPDGRDAILAAWIALDDVDLSNGGVAVFPGTHQLGLVHVKRDWRYLLKRSPEVLRALKRRAFSEGAGDPDDTAVMERYTYAQLPPHAEAITPAMTAGSVLFMHGDIIHQSTPNRTNRLRRCLIANYVRTGTRFATGLHGRAVFEVRTARPGA